MGVSFSAGLPKSPPNVEPLVVVGVPEAAPSFFSSLGGPNRLAEVAGTASFFSSGFAASLFAGAPPNSPPPPVPPVAPKGKLPGSDASGFFTPNRLPPDAGVVVEVDVEGVALSAGLGGSPKNPPVAGTVVVVVVVVDESLAGLGGPPNNPPVVVLVLGVPPNSPLVVATGGNQR